MRLAAILDREAALAWGDARGLLADLGSSLVVASLLIALLRIGRCWLGRGLALALLLAWTTSHVANFEHINTLGTVLSLSNAGFLLDGTFLLGSALHLSRPLLSLAFLIGSATVFLVGSRAIPPLRSSAALAMSGLALLGLHAATPVATNVVTWRQTHFLVDHLERLGPSTELARSEGSIPGVFPGDLEGEPIVPLGHLDQNVLLVVLEGVSGAYIDRIAEIHGLRGERPRIASLDRLARRGYTLVNFVTQQRQTNRGLYSLVCGDLPKQTTAAPKMSEVAILQTEALCLPRALRRHGYRTAFLQSAPLSFMAKDKFAPLAGFDRVHGFEWFRNRGVEKSAGRWGVDDRTFLAGALDLIAELERGDSPWLLTLLNSGTHHPFTVPDEFESEHPDHTFARALDFLDRATTDFLAALERSGVREDTLVLITSDESFGLGGGGTELGDDALMLSQAWGFLIALLPTRDTREIRSPFMQTDVALSTLDYLGLRREAEHFHGRSIFRSYESPRPIPFANGYMRMTGMLHEDARLTLCREDLSGCRGYLLDDPPLLFAGHMPIDDDARESEGEEIALLGDLVARSGEVASVPKVHETRVLTWRLIETPSTMVLSRRALEEVRQRIQRGRPLPDEDANEPLLPIFGNQYLSLPARHRATIELELEIRGDEPVYLVHALSAVPLDAMPSIKSYRENVAFRARAEGFHEDTLGIHPQFSDLTRHLGITRRLVRPGEPFRLRYSYSSDEAHERLDANLLARPTGDQITGLVIWKAVLQIAALEADDEPEGLVIHEYSHKEADRSNDTRTQVR